MTTSPMICVFVLKLANTRRAASLESAAPLATGKCVRVVRPQGRKTAGFKELAWDRGEIEAARSVIERTMLE